MGLWDLIARGGQGLLRRAAMQLQFKLPDDPVPEEWHRILERRVPLARHLDDPGRERLLRVARLMLDDVQFEGCAGLVVDEEIRVTIAATASLLVHRLLLPRFSSLKRVLIYPDPFIPKRVSGDDPGIVHDDEPSLGEAWFSGVVVLAWSTVKGESENPRSKTNVVLHEMAHILDGEDGDFDGTPLLEDPNHGPAWAAVLDEEFDRHHRAVERGAEVALDEYGARNHAEFFAVATEAFFCAPDRLRGRLPELYEQLSRFYRQDSLPPAV